MHPAYAPNCPIMQIPREHWALVFEQRNEVIDRDHPDFDFWAEESQLLELAEGSASPPAETPPKATKPSVPTLALNLTDAATALSLSGDHFREHVKPTLKIVRGGRRQFVSVRELERWLAENEASA